MTARARTRCHRRLAALVAELAAAAGMAAALLAGCGGAPATALVLYSGQHVQTTQALVAAFEKATGVTVQVRYNDEDFFANEIVEEASHPKADIFYTENSPPLEYLQRRGLLAHLPLSVTASVPARYRSPAGAWVGISARASVLVYDPGLIKRSGLPTHALDMASPRYKGKLALAPGETDFQPVVTSMARAYGASRAVAWLRAVGANAAGHIYSDNEAVTNEVNRGAVAFGLVDQYYWYRLRAEIGRRNVHSALAYFAPRDPGYVVDVSGAGVLASSKHRVEADKFVAFLVSRQGQEIIARSQSFEYPLGAGVKPGADETPLSRLQPYPISVEQLGDGSTARALLTRAGLQ